MKSFLMAGSDTSSSTICYIYHMLSKNPEKMKIVRKELFDLFGTVDGEVVGERLKVEPGLVGQMVYSTAVIKGMFLYSISPILGETWPSGICLGQVPGRKSTKSFLFAMFTNIF